MYVAIAPTPVPDVVGGFAFGIAGGCPQPEAREESVLIAHVCRSTDSWIFTRVEKYGDYDLLK